MIWLAWSCPPLWWRYRTMPSITALPWRLWSSPRKRDPLSSPASHHPLADYDSHRAVRQCIFSYSLIYIVTDIFLHLTDFCMLYVLILILYRNYRYSVHYLLTFFSLSGPCWELGPMHSTAILFHQWWFHRKYHFHIFLVSPPVPMLLQYSIVAI